MSISNEPVEAAWVKELRADSKLLGELLSILQNHAGERGDSEGAVETLTRIIRERDKTFADQTH